VSVGFANSSIIFDCLRFVNSRKTFCFCVLEIPV